MNPANHEQQFRARPRESRIAEMADPAELARFRAAPDAPEARVRIAEHIVRRHPDCVRPWLMLAEHAPTQLVRTAYLRKAVQVGHAMWDPWLKEDRSVMWWTDKATRPFMMALGLYGAHLADRGRTDMATQYLRLLLKLDSTDQMGAVPLFSEVGLIQPDAGSSTPGMMM